MKIINYHLHKGFLHPNTHAHINYHNKMFHTQATNIYCIQFITGTLSLYGSYQNPHFIHEEVNHQRGQRTCQFSGKTRILTQDSKHSILSNSPQTSISNTKVKRKERREGSLLKEVKGHSLWIKKNQKHQLLLSIYQLSFNKLIQG